MELVKWYIQGFGFLVKFLRVDEAYLVDLGEVDLVGQADHLEELTLRINPQVGLLQHLRLSLVLLHPRLTRLPTLLTPIPAPIDIAVPKTIPIAHRSTFLRIKAYLLILIVLIILILTWQRELRHHNVLHILNLLIGVPLV